MEMNETARSLMDWLQGQTRQWVRIRKEEQGDLDEVRIRLQEVGYRQGGPTIDGYTGADVLVLHGEGTIASRAGEVPLPGDSYWIPVGGLSVASGPGGGVTFRTDRATYAVTPDNGRPH